MASKPKNPTSRGKGRHVLKVEGVKGDAFDALTAKKLLRPECLSAALIQKLEGDALEINAAVQELTTQIEAVHRGDMRRPEAMLVAQAHALNDLFANLACRSHSNMGGGYLDAADRYMRLALKAQSQCRATLETLAAIKNPPIVYARQANVTTGPQQVNNGIPAPSQAREIESEQTQLSGGTHELLPDARASGIASRVNSTLEAVGEIHRAADRGREG